MRLLSTLLRSGRCFIVWRTSTAEGAGCRRGQTCKVWKVGESGNPDGRRKDKLFRDALIMELKTKGEDMPELRKISRRMIDAAQGVQPKPERGKKAVPAYTPEFATQVIIDRLDGKAAQATTGSSTEPVVVALNYSGRCINDS